MGYSQTLNVVSFPAMKMIVWKKKNILDDVTCRLVVNEDHANTKFSSMDLKLELLP